MQPQKLPDIPVSLEGNTEVPSSPRETGLILRCAGKAGNPFQTTQGNRHSCRDQEGRTGTDEAVPGLSVFPRGYPACRGAFGCQFRASPAPPSGAHLGGSGAAWAWRQLPRWTWGQASTSEPPPPGHWSVQGEPVGPVRTETLWGGLVERHRVSCQPHGHGASEASGIHLRARPAGGRAALRTRVDGRAEPGLSCTQGQSQLFRAASFCSSQ